MKAELIEMGDESGKHQSACFPTMLTGRFCLVLLQVVLELARLYLLQGQLDLCEQHCASLLQSEQNHETASVVWGPQTFCLPSPGSL